jgi:hypothetical protein
VALVRRAVFSLPLPDLSGRLLLQADAVHGAGEVLRSERLLLQAVALHVAGEMLRPERLLLQAAASDVAAVPDALLYLRPAADVRPRELQRREECGSVGGFVAAASRRGLREDEVVGQSSGSASLLVQSGVQTIVTRPPPVFRFTALFPCFPAWGDGWAGARSRGRHGICDERSTISMKITSATG